MPGRLAAATAAATSKLILLLSSAGTSSWQTQCVQLTPLRISPHYALCAVHGLNRFQTDGEIVK